MEGVEGVEGAGGWERGNDSEIVPRKKMPSLRNLFCPGVFPIISPAMRLTKIELGNWKNFVRAEARLASRVFIVGGNGVGKSNLLDAFRFLHDIAKEGGGLRNALESRGGIGRVRSLFARRDPVVRICAEVDEDSDGEAASGANGRPPRWRYELALKQEQAGKRRTLVDSEKVEEDGKPIVVRPDADDKRDRERLTQTAMEQTIANSDFRGLADFFRSFRYLHMVPQLVRHAPEFQGRILPDDPFGQGLMRSIAKIKSSKIRKSRLRRIGGALQTIMPRMNPELDFSPGDGVNQSHLKVRYEDWRKYGTVQTEEQLSDGALRLIALVWALLEGRDVIMLEEPEISFNEGLVKKLPGVFADAVLSRKKGEHASQVILTTHSAALLEDGGIGADETLLLTQGGEGTTVLPVCEDAGMMAELKNGGASIGEVALRHCQTSGGVSL